MNKKYIIRKNEEIQKILKQSKKIANKYFVIYYNDNNLKYNRYCISVSKKLGKAHYRNLLKRRVKDIIMKFNFNNSIDYVIILRNSILNLDYSSIKDELYKIMKGDIK